MGRFLQRDPIGYYDSMNLYQYVGNNSTNWLDSSGLSVFNPFMPFAPSFPQFPWEQSNMMKCLGGGHDGNNPNEPQQPSPWDYIWGDLGDRMAGALPDWINDGFPWDPLISGALGKGAEIIGNILNLTKDWGLKYDAPHGQMGPHIQWGPKYPGSNHPQYHFGPKAPKGGPGSWKGWWDWFKRGPKSWRWRWK